MFRVHSAMFFVAFLVIFAIFVESVAQDGDFTSFGSDIWDPSLKRDPAKVEALRQLLYPHRMTEEQLIETEKTRNLLAGYQQTVMGEGSAKERRLQGYHDRPDEPPQCVKCIGLETCRVLNNKRIEEMYYPIELMGSAGSDANTCTILEQLGNRVSGEVFGTGRTFRDTPTCREMVNQYLCLFWGSDNLMYRNLCIWFEETDDAEAINHVKSPRPPCRSFCVQVAEVCANDHHFLQLCHDIACPPSGMDCESDPSIDVDGVLYPLDADLGCDLPYEIDPYGVGENAAPISRPSPLLLIVSTLMLGYAARN